MAETRPIQRSTERIDRAAHDNAGAKRGAVLGKDAEVAEEMSLKPVTLSRRRAKRRFQ